MKLTVVSDPVHGGEVVIQPASTTGAYYPQDNVTLTASAKPGYKFVNWTGSVGEITDTNESTVTIEMNKYYSKGTTAIDITANFALKSWFNWGYPVVSCLAISAVVIVLAIVRSMRPREPEDA